VQKRYSNTLRSTQERSLVIPVDERYEETTKGLNSEFGLKKICLSTIYKWLKLLGFKYEPQRKGDYVDGHEKPETVNYRNKYVKCYMTRKTRGSGK
jgi:hypothetical protein